MEPDVSVVVPTYQRRASVERLLHALAAQTFPPTSFETIVAIDGSSDGTVELVGSFEAPYALSGIRQPNRGRAAACNTAIRASRGELIVILDDDMEPTPGLLNAHRAAHPPDSRRCVMGAVPIPLRQGMPPSGRYVAMKFGRHLTRLARPEHRFTLRDFYSGNASLRREVLLEVGTFDEDFTLYGNEDLELAFRLRRAGVELVFSPKALAYQTWDKNFGALARDTVEKGRTAVLLARKHPAAIPESRLATRQAASITRRLVRKILLAATMARPALVNDATSLGCWIDRHDVHRSVLFFDVMLDYLYWTGVEDAPRLEGEVLASSAPSERGPDCLPLHR